MAILTPIILLAQNASSTINENLQVTEDKLQNANQELDLLKEQYNNMLTQAPETTFFNFGNMYFWFVLVGLLLLAFGLLFLLAELQNKDKKAKHKNKAEEKIESDKNEEVEDDTEEEVVEEESELAKESEEEKIEEELLEEDDDEEEEDEKSVKKMDKPIKIKVEKIK